MSQALNLITKLSEAHAEQIKNRADKLESPIREDIWEGLSDRYRENEISFSRAEGLPKGGSDLYVTIDGFTFRISVKLVE